MFRHRSDRSCYWPPHVVHNFVHLLVQFLEEVWQIVEPLVLVDYWHYLDRFLTLDDWKIERKFVDHSIESAWQQNNSSWLEHVPHYQIAGMPNKTNSSSSSSKKTRKFLLDFSFSNWGHSWSCQKQVRIEQFLIHSHRYSVNELQSIVLRSCMNAERLLTNTWGRTFF